jgi:hypothetical protein
MGGARIAADIGGGACVSTGRLPRLRVLGSSRLWRVGPLPQMRLFHAGQAPDGNGQVPGGQVVRR